MKRVFVYLSVLIITINLISFCGCDNANLNDTHTTHDYKISTKLATCTEQGYDLFKCDCGNEYKNNFKNPLCHDLTEWFETLAPTTNAKGEFLLATFLH